MRRFLRFMPPFLLLISLILAGFACGGGGGDTKSPLELLQEKVSANTSAIANFNAATPADVRQLRLDLDAIAAQISDIAYTDNTEELDALLVDFTDLVVRMDDLENGYNSVEDGLYCQPLNMIFLSEAGGDNPLPQTLTVDLPVDTSWYAFEGESWLAISPTAGAEPMVMIVSVDITDLPIGVYYANIAVITVSEVVEISVTLGVLDLP